MSIKKTMLAAALAAFAFAALPAFASAHPVLDIQEGGSGHFTITGEETSVLTTVNPKTPKVLCGHVDGTGEFEGNPSTTGTIELTFTECESSETSCGTEKASSGDIEVGPLPFHLVTATDVTEGGGPVDAILVTPTNPNEEGVGQFTTFKCAFGLISVQVRGTGVIGEIENWEELTNKASNTFSVKFAAHEGEDTQTYETTEENPGKVFDLEAKVGSGAWETAVQVGTGIGTFTEGSKNTLTKGTE